MLATLLAGDGTVAGGEELSYAQLPLLLATRVEPALRHGTVINTVVHGVDLSVSEPSDSRTQLPLLLAMLPLVTNALTTGTVTPVFEFHGVDLSGAGTRTLSTGHIPSAAVVHGIDTGESRFVDVATGCPQIQVEIDFNEPTGPTRVWTDVTEYVRSVQITRGGRNHELQRLDVGTCTIVLDNRAGQFDPSNLDTRGLPPLRRMQWVRVRALWGTRIYGRAQMVIEAVDLQWPATGYDATATLRCADPLKILALYDLEGQLLPEETTGARVERVLELAGIAGYDIETGQSVVVDNADPLPEGTVALEHLRAVEETENGQLFANGDGTIVFHDRHHRILDTATGATVGDDPGEIPYRAASLSLEDSAIYNRVRVTTASDIPKEAEDAVSIERYFERRLNRTLLSDDENEAQAAAEYLLGLYADPSDRLPAIQLLGQADPSAWPTILGLGNSDKLVWRRRPATETSSRTIEKPVIVERVQDTVAVGQGWSVTVEVSPADVTDFWILGVAGRSELGQTTTLAY